MYTIPAQREIKHRQSITPEYMWPNSYPDAVVYPGLLTDAQCDAILHEGMKLRAYKFPSCEAQTREFEMPLNWRLNEIMLHVLRTNLEFWNFVLDTRAAAWLQTYESGDEYDVHVDTSPGQTRKLTAVAMLSSDRDYVGGDLKLYIPQRTFSIPRERGTVVVFLPWVHHFVNPVTDGMRQTVNMGFYGPPFR